MWQSLADNWVLILIVIGVAATVFGVVMSLAVAAKRGDAVRGHLLDPHAGGGRDTDHGSARPKGPERPT